MPFAKHMHLNFYVLLVITLSTSCAVINTLSNPSDLNKTYVLATPISTILAAAHHLGSSAPSVASVWALGWKSSPPCSHGREKRAREGRKQSMALKTSAWEWTCHTHSATTDKIKSHGQPPWQWSSSVYPSHWGCQSNYGVGV